MTHSLFDYGDEKASLNNHESCMYSYCSEPSIRTEELDGFVFLVTFGYIKNNEIGRSRDSYGGRKKCIKKFGYEMSKERTTRKTSKEMGA
jgi:hypothetical protein